MTSEARRSPLAMAVLLLLGEEPLHPYGLRRRIKEWDKDRVINVSQRNAIYQTVERLERSGLIEVKETTRQDNRPDRTVYAATAEGVALAKGWLLDMLSSPVPEYTDFPAALAFLPAMPLSAVLDALRTRADRLEVRIAEHDAEVAAGVAAVPGGVERIYLIESDYQRTMWQAELTWVGGLVEELQSSDRSAPR